MLLGGEKYADALKVAYTLQDIFPGYTSTKDIFYCCFDGWVVTGLLDTAVTLCWESLLQDLQVVCHSLNGTSQWEFQATLYNNNMIIL